MRRFIVYQNYFETSRGDPVRTGPQCCLLVMQGTLTDWAAISEEPCYSKCGTINIPLSSKVMFCSPSPVMVMSLYN